MSVAMRHPSGVRIQVTIIKNGLGTGVRGQPLQFLGVKVVRNSHGHVDVKLHGFLDPRTGMLEKLTG